MLWSFISEPEEVPLDAMILAGCARSELELVENAQLKLKTPLGEM